MFFAIRVAAVTVIASGMAWSADIRPQVRAALGRINADSLRGHVSFLASDLLEGRGTPSRGLDLAAEYIAAQFRRAGLEPAGDDGYFQTAPFLSVTPNPDGLKFEVTGQDPVEPGKVTTDATAGLSLQNAAAVKAGPGESVDGKVVFIHAADFWAVVEARQQMRESKPLLIVITGPGARMRSRAVLIPADERGKRVPAVTVRDERLAAKIEAAAAGPLPFQVSVNIPAPGEKSVTLRNVAGLLRGSDPELKNTYELVTAHYDHLGMRGDGQDRIYNGANDDASGTVSLIEIASALATLEPRPRRSILFIALFGEEIGLLGSRYYGSHPLVPLANTVADVNLEHMGRTDSDLGPHVGMVNFTGFDYSDVPSIFIKAGEATGIRVVKDEKNSDPYFARSDNQALADLGVPAHTISVSYEFPEYHQPGDEWQKLDYENMARVDRMVALGLEMIADNAQAPRWSESEPKAQKYAGAAKKLKREVNALKDKAEPAADGARRIGEHH